VLRLDVEEMAPLREELIWLSEVLVPAPPPIAVLSESILELAELIEPLMTVLTAVLRLDVEEIAPLREELIWLREVLCPLSTVLTAVLRLVTCEATPLIDPLMPELRLATAETVVEIAVDSATEVPWATPAPVARPTVRRPVRLRSCAGPWPVPGRRPRT